METPKPRATDAIDVSDVKDISKKLHVIVTFSTPDVLVSPGPGKFFQVTIDPENLSPSKTFIRFGETPGDELMGWQRADWIKVVEVLGIYEDNITIVRNPGVTVVQ